MPSDAYKAIMGSAAPRSSSSSASKSKSSAYDAIMGGGSSSVSNSPNIGSSDWTRRTITSGGSRQSFAGDLPFTRESFQKSIDLGLSAVEGKRGEVIELRRAMELMGSATGQTSFNSSKPSWQLEDDLNGTNAEIASRDTGRYMGYREDAAKPMSSRFAEFASDVRGAADEGYYGMARGQRWFMERAISPFVGNLPDSLNPQDLKRWSADIGDAPDLRHTTDSRNDFGLQAWRTIYNIPVSALDILGLGYQIGEAPNRTPEILGSVWSGLVESVNVIDPNATPAEKFGRTLNAALMVAGALEGAGRGAAKGASIRSRFEAKAISKEFGVDVIEAQKFVDATRTSLKETAQSKSPVAAFAADIGEALFAKDSKIAAGELRTKIQSYAEEAKALHPDNPVGSSASVGAAPAEVLGKSGRIDFEPIAITSEVLKPAQIIGQLFDELNQTAPRKGKVRWGEAAKYNDAEGTITLGRDGDLRNVGHELGHHVTEMFEGLIKTWDKPRSKSPFDSELFGIPLGRKVPKSWTLAQKRYEAVAEFMRLYMLNPTKAKDLAPTFFDHFESVVPDTVRNPIIKSGEAARMFLSQDADQIVSAAVQTRTSAPLSKPKQFAKAAAEFLSDVKNVRKPISEKASRPFDTNAITELNRVVNNDQAALGKAAQYIDEVTGRKDVLPEDDVVLLGRKSRYVDGAVLAVLEEGVRNINGQVVLDSTTGQPLSLKTILEPLQNKSELGEMMNVGVSERIIAEAADITSGAKVEAAKQRKHAAFNEKTAKEYLKHADEFTKSGDRIKAKISKGIADKHFEAAKKNIEAAIKIEDEAAIKSQNLSPVGAGELEPIRIHKEMIENLQRSEPEKWVRIQESLRRYREFSRALLDFAKESGLITQDHLDNMMAKSDSYFDLGRVVDDAAESIGLTGELHAARKASGMKAATGKFKGSTKDFESGIVNLAFNVRAIINLSERNNVIGALVKPIEDASLTVQQKNLLASVARRVKSGEGGQNAVTYIRDGISERWELHPGLAAIYNGNSAMTANNWFWKMAELPNRLLRDGVTMVPAFVVRNFIRDSAERFIKSKPGTTGKAGETIRAYYATDSDIAQYDYFGGGLRHSGEDAGSWTGFARMQKEAAIRAEVEGYKTYPLKKGITKYNEWRERTERSNRLVEYRRVYEATVQELQTKNADLPKEKQLSSDRISYNANLKAGQAARDLIDFAESGTYARAVNRFIVPFTTASIAGTRSSIRAFKANPTAYMMKAFVTQGTLIVAQEAWNASQGATDKFEQQPAYLKDMFALFYVPGVDGFIRIPKPHLEGVLMSALPRAARQDWDGYFENFVKSFIPISAEAALGNPWFKTYGGMRANFDDFKGSPIISRYEEGLDLSLRDTSSASGLGQLLQSITGQDARMIDFAGRGLTGNLATTAQQASNLLTKGKTQSPAQITNLITGLAADAADYSARDVVAVGELARKSGVKTSPLKPWLERVRSAEKSGDISQVKEARSALYERAGMIRSRVESESAGLKGVEKWKRIKALLGS